MAKLTGRARRPSAPASGSCELLTVARGATEGSLTEITTRRRAATSPQRFVHAAGGGAAGSEAGDANAAAQTLYRAQKYYNNTPTHPRPRATAARPRCTRRSEPNSARPWSTCRRESCIHMEDLRAHLVKQALAANIKNADMCPFVFSRCDWSLLAQVRRMLHCGCVCISTIITKKGRLFFV